MKQITFAVQPSLRTSEILLSCNLLFSSTTLEKLKSLNNRFALFCDLQVFSYWGEKWYHFLKQEGLDITLFTFPSGEQEKSRERKALLEDSLLSNQFGKDTCMIALGGGVVTDLIGFLASTFCRGVCLIVVPTTFLGMVDAAIGGKNGINTSSGKNLIGTFYLPEYVFIDPTLLSTLSSQERTNAIAEIIKYSLIQSSELFQLLKKHDPFDPLFLEQILYESIQIKTKIVTLDFEEKKGIRRILNFGHTIGHALELLENYTLKHGEAVAIGMLVESYLSLQMGYLSASSFIAIDELVRSFAFSLTLTEAVTVDKMKEALLYDKKASHKIPRFVLLENIGSCHCFNYNYCSCVPPAILEQALQWMIEQFLKKDVCHL